MPFVPHALVICTSSNKKQSVIRRPLMASSIELFLILIVGAEIDDCCDRISSTESYPLKSCFNFLTNIVLCCVLRNLGFIKKLMQG